MSSSGNPAGAGSGSAASIHAALRRHTQPCHDRVDAAFGRFDLASREGYGAFLTAHARVLPPLERALAQARLTDGWTGRAPLLAADLASLGLPLPPAADIDLPAGTGGPWGALYVVEGSRLGGAVLARRVGARLPVAYLSAVHQPGGWKRIVAAIEGAASGPAWLDEAIAAANSVFAAFESAAREERMRG